MRGGGGNFGVVTAMDFRLHRIGNVLAGHLKYPIRQAREVLRFLNRYAPTIPDELFILAAVLPFPGERMLDLAVVWNGEETEGERVLRPLRRFMKPFEDSIKSKPYLDEQREGSDSPSDGDYSSCRRGGHLERLDARTIDVIAQFASSRAERIQRHHHDVLARAVVFAAARQCIRISAHRVRILGAFVLAGRRCARGLDWMGRGFLRRAQPYSSGAVYINDLENEGDARVRAAYGDSYERLATIKRKYDPANFFRINQNIKQNIKPRSAAFAFPQRRGTLRCGNHLHRKSHRRGQRSQGRLRAMVEGRVRDRIKAI